MRIVGFEPDQFLHQGVVLGVRNLRVVENIVAVIVMVEGRSQLCDSFDDVRIDRGCWHKRLIISQARDRPDAKASVLNPGNQ